jgi:hypothetical protein
LIRKRHPGNGDYLDIVAEKDVKSQGWERRICYNLVPARLKPTMKVVVDGQKGR